LIFETSLFGFVPVKYNIYIDDTMIKIPFPMVKSRKKKFENISRNLCQMIKSSWNYFINMLILLLFWSDQGG